MCGDDLLVAVGVRTAVGSEDAVGTGAPPLNALATSASSLEALRRR